MTKSIVKYLLYRPKWQRLPRLPRMYSVEFDKRLADRETQTLMRQSHTRSPQGVDILKARHNKQTAIQLIRSLPPAKRTRQIKRRLRNLICVIFGLTFYDPARTLYERETRSSRRRR